MTHNAPLTTPSETPNADLLEAQQALIFAAQVALPDITKLNELKKSGYGRLTPQVLAIQERPAMAAYYGALCRVEMTLSESRSADAPRV